MKKLVASSVASFIFGCLFTYFLSQQFFKMAIEIGAAVQIPSDISMAQDSLRLLEEEKYDALHATLVLRLRCGIQSLETAYAQNERFTTPEHIARVKERASKYTRDFSCSFPLSE